MNRVDDILGDYWYLLQCASVRGAISIEESVIFHDKFKRLEAESKMPPCEDGNVHICGKCGISFP